jgi:hypothetical protein
MVLYSMLSVVKLGEKEIRDSNSCGCPVWHHHAILKEGYLMAFSLDPESSGKPVVGPRDRHLHVVWPGSKQRAVIYPLDPEVPLVISILVPYL